MQGLSGKFDAKTKLSRDSAESGAALDESFSTVARSPANSSRGTDAYHIDSGQLDCAWNQKGPLKQLRGYEWGYVDYAGPPLLQEKRVIHVFALLGERKYLFPFPSRRATSFKAACQTEHSWCHSTFYLLGEPLSSAL
ncbi:hypothetical protein NKR23_g11000 [Pleurostoma richardsiae]|uniref:Uncharacterized protein n=1 Tax=Pleurostoma richardsiae TaxID=41990 RepID=A0AA38RBL7_9PEZI|nr:hypothetical protein NKR23_g11000 [Pleurostoma richardsiae]